MGSDGSSQATTQLTLTISLSNPSFAPASANINLPIVNVNTSGVGIVDKVTNVPGTIAITSPDGQTSYLPNSGDSDNTATFHVHGNSTALMPKLAYHVKLNTSLDLLGAMGMVCPYVTSSGKPICDKSKSYILLANYADKTLLRDWAASTLANAIPIGNGYLDSPPGSPTPSGTKALMPWAPHSLFIELYLNGVYEGNYQLSEEIKIDSHKVNITELADTDTSPTQVTGGYLMEIDAGQTEDYFFVTPRTIDIGLIDPDFAPDPQIPEQNSFITNYMIAAETALFAANFTDPTEGWRAYFDEASAVNFYIVNDVMGNVDGGAFVSSDYLYKDRNNPLIYMGPVWDFDISSGNVNYQSIVSPTAPWMQITPWYAQWFRDPGFQADVAKQFNALKQNGVFTAWLASINQQAASLEQSQANNFGRWPMQGIEVWPNSEAAGSYDGEVSFFTNWLEMRIAYLDSLFNNKVQTTTALRTATGTVRTGSPVTIFAQVSGVASPSGVVSFLSNGVPIGKTTVDNSGTARLTVASLPRGQLNLQAFYHGDDENAPSASKAQPVTVAAPLSATDTTIAASSAQNNTATLTVSVAGNTGGVIPSGTVAFTVDQTAATAVKLDAHGQATYSAISLTAGTHTVKARYLGDENYLASSGVTTVTASASQAAVAAGNNDVAVVTDLVGRGVSYLDSLINPKAPDFALAASPSVLSIAVDQSATVLITVTSQRIGAMNFSCSGLPAGVSCTFSPLISAASGPTSTTSLTISTTAGSPATSTVVVSAASGPVSRSTALSLRLR